MWKRSSKSTPSVLPTTAPAASSSSAASGVPPPKNPKRHRRPNLGLSASSSAAGAFSHADHRQHGFDPNRSCTNFLLGGTYYPGKDKTASHLLRRRSVWYRIFCSSPPRVCATVAVLAYVALWYVFVPTVAVLMDYGRTLAGGGGGGRRGAGAEGGGGLSSEAEAAGLRLNLTPIDAARADALRLFEKVREIRRDDAAGRRAGALERIVPQWVHRNDPGAEGLVDGEEGEIDEAGEEGAQGKKAEEDKVQLSGQDAGEDDPDAVHGDDGGKVGEDGDGVTDRADAPSGDDAGGDKSGDAKGDDHDRFEGSDDYSAADADEETNNSKDDEGGKDSLVQGVKKGKRVTKGDVNVVNDGNQKNDKKAKDVDQRTNEKAADPKEGHASGAAEARVRRTLQNMDEIPSSSSCPSNLSPDDISTTLVIQASFDRLNLLLETCSRWSAPIILVLYLANDDEEGSWSGSQSMWEEMCPQMTIIPHLAVGAEREARAYPVNMLRNIGLDAVRTSHVMMMDVDFIPSVDLHDTIQDTLKARHQMNNVEGVASSDYREALIVPAFERKPPKECETIEECMEYLKKDSNFIPRYIDGLRDCVKRKDCIVFQGDVNWEGHHTTHSEEWLKGDWYQDGNYREPPVNTRTEKKKRREKIDLGRKIKKVECFDSLRYEPWVVLRWCPSPPPAVADSGNHRPVAPYYDERFHGYGKNKIEMTAHLRFLGYSFSILPLSFIIHQPHPESKAKQVWVDADKDDLHHEMDALYPKFLRELATRYEGGKNAIPTCGNDPKKKKAKKKRDGR